MTQIRNIFIKGAREHNLKNLDIEIFPNPSNGVTTLGFNLKKSMQVKAALFNVAGIEITEVLNTELPSGEYKKQVDISHLAAGAYFLKIEAEGTATTKKLIITK